MYGVLTCIYRLCRIVDAIFCIAADNFDFFLRDEYVVSVVDVVSDHVDTLSSDWFGVVICFVGSTGGAGALFFFGLPGRRFTGAAF